MSQAHLVAVLQHIRRLVIDHTMSNWTDGQLLEALPTAQREAAFAVLLLRHGPMVWWLCRRQLRNWHDAEDAFQATFLILARRASSIRKRHSLASWLYGVAWRVTTRAKAVAVRQQAREREVMLTMKPILTEESRPEWQQVLQEELSWLPEKYRAALVLCYLQGKTQAMAAQELGWPRGSIAKRLARGRELLRQRLSDRGLALPAGLISAMLTEEAMAATVPSTLVRITLRSAVFDLVSPSAAVPGISASAMALANGVLRAMTTAKLKLAASALATFLVAGGAGTLIHPSRAAPRPELEQPSLSTPAVQIVRPQQERPSAAAAQEGALEQSEVGKRAFEALGVAFSPDGRTLATASGYRDEGGALLLWDPITGRRRVLRTDRFGIRTVAFSPDGRTLAAAGWDETVRLLEVANGKERAVLRGSEELAAAPRTWGNRLINAVAFSPDGKLLASAHGDGTVRLWDIPGGRSVRTLSGHTGRALGVAFFPDGKTLASTSADTTLKFWDMNTGRETASFAAHQAGAEGLAISPDGQTLATSGWEGSVKLWDAATGKERATLHGHAYSIATVAFSPDGKSLASCSGNWSDPSVAGEVKVWDVANARELLTLPTGHMSGILSVCFSPDGKTLVTASRDQTIKIWEVATWQERLTLPLDARGPAGHSSTRLESVWDDLADPDAAKAYRALSTLVRAAPQAVALARERLHSVSSGERLQALRGIEVLEKIGTPDARQVLERLAKGPPQARMTQEAKASLERLAQRAAAAP